MIEPFRTEVTLRWSDGDLQGVVNNAVFLSVFEEARLAYFRALDAMRGESFPFLLGSTALRFVRPGRAGSRVGVTARVTRLGGASFDMEYRVESTSGELLVTGTATLVWTDAGLRSEAIPAEIRRRVARREGIPERSDRAT
ncbi:MAG: acyl-CoA thioesterase [Planctomycetes bacterium]|nr:acyl-CoA thioesterase [Planctomycetota bacterium]